MRRCGHAEEGGGRAEDRDGPHAEVGYDLQRQVLERSGTLVLIMHVRLSCGILQLCSGDKTQNDRDPHAGGCMHRRFTSVHVSPFIYLSSDAHCLGTMICLDSPSF